MACGMACSQLASLVTSSGTNSAVAPDWRSASAVCFPRSSRTSAMTMAAPTRASASAIPAPSPRPPPVTSAFRPVSSYSHQAPLPGTAMGPPDRSAGLRIV